MAATSPYWWHRQTIEETFERICSGTTPWVAIGDFLDDWRRSAVEHRSELVDTPIAPAPTAEMQRWAAFCAAMVEWLCWQDDLPWPTWTDQDSYILAEPWFIYEGKRLRAWQLVTTPAGSRCATSMGEIGCLIVCKSMIDRVPYTFALLV